MQRNFRERSALVAVAILPLVSCASATRIGGQAGRAPVAPRGYTAPEPTGLIRTPRGDWIVAGSRDALGWVLPLDVARPGDEGEPVRRSSKPHGPASAALQGAFPETRLGPDNGHTQNEPSVAIDGPTIVAAWQQSDGTIVELGVARSGDGGRSWTETSIQAGDVAGDAVVAAAGNGVWFLAYIGLDEFSGADFEVYVRRSDDDGRTFAAPVAVTSNTSFDDKPWIAARGDDVLAVWADFSFSPARVRAAASHDGGRTFTDHTVLVVNSGGGNGAAPVIAPDGTWYVFWRDSFQQFLWVASSVDGGRTWSPDREVAAMMPLPNPLPGAAYRMLNLAYAAVDPRSGALLVLWNDQLFGDPDILAVRSSDRGQTWSAPVRVSDDPGTSAQFFPFVSFEPGGTAHAVWYDRRGNDRDVAVRWATSSDDGQSWSASQELDAGPFTPVLPSEPGLASFIGDYIGIAAGAGFAGATYQDSRRGEQDVYVAVVAAPCVIDALERIVALQAVRVAGTADVRLAWPPLAAAAEGYDVWFVTAKSDLPACAMCGPGASAVPGCQPTGNAAAAGCTHQGALDAAMGTLLLYDVRGSCQGQEGP